MEGSAVVVVTAMSNINHFRVKSVSNVEVEVFGFLLRYIDLLLKYHDWTETRTQPGNNYISRSEALWCFLECLN